MQFALARYPGEVAAGPGRAPQELALRGPQECGIGSRVAAQILRSRTFGSAAFQDQCVGIEFDGGLCEITVGQSGREPLDDGGGVRRPRGHIEAGDVAGTRMTLRRRRGLIRDERGGHCDQQDDGDARMVAAVHDRFLDGCG